MEMKDFPPFYTIQPVEVTRKKQLELWRQLILKQLGGNQLMIIDLESFELFSNPNIRRALNLDGRRVICESLIEMGMGEWEDARVQSRFRVFSRSPQAWAKVVLEWARMNGKLGQEISTFYEIHSGEDSEGTELEGLNPDVLLKSIKFLEKEGRVFLYPGANLDEMGIKFL
jgi:ESCRT-II complex subunit VPS25